MQLSIFDLLYSLVEHGASDLHIKAGAPPGFRVDGELVPQQEYGVLDSSVTSRLVRELMTEEQWERFSHDRDLDFSIEIPDVARFRVNALMQRDAFGLIARVIPSTVPSAKELGLPQICLDLALKPRGLVLITGQTGSGKSTTLAAMIDHVNENVAGHILTMEDPLEFAHSDKRCYVTQRNIGHDCTSFREALRRALRQDPDVMLIGEMRDLETISMAITAAETGHLVFGTLHTTSVMSTVDRIIDVFPTESQQQVRVQLASTLQGVVSQCLVSRIGGGRVAAREILVATDAVRALIREGRTSQMLNVLQTGRAHGMQSLENHLIELVESGQVSIEDAIGKANRPQEIEKNARPGRAPMGSMSPAFGSARGGSGVGRPGVGARPSSTASGVARASRPSGLGPRPGNGLGPRG